MKNNKNVKSFGKFNENLNISDINDSKDYRVITPNGDIISVEEYMETDDYNNRLEKQIDDFMDNKKQKELINLFKRSTNR